MSSLRSSSFKVAFPNHVFTVTSAETPLLCFQVQEWCNITCNTSESWRRPAKSNIILNYTAESHSALFIRRRCLSAAHIHMHEPMLVFLVNLLLRQEDSYGAKQKHVPQKESYLSLKKLEDGKISIFG